MKPLPAQSAWSGGSTENWFPPLAKRWLNRFSPWKCVPSSGFDFAFLLGLTGCPLPVTAPGSVRFVPSPKSSPSPESVSPFVAWSISVVSTTGPPAPPPDGVNDVDPTSVRGTVVGVIVDAAPVAFAATAARAIKTASGTASSNARRILSPSYWVRGDQRRFGRRVANKSEQLLSSRRVVLLRRDVRLDEGGGMQPCRIHHVGLPVSDLD